MSSDSLNLFVPSKAPNHRQQKVAEEVRFLLAQELTRGHIPAHTMKDGSLKTLPTSVTLTHVTVSPDLKHATVLVMPLGGEKIKETLEFLTAAAPYLRKVLSQKLSLRVTPKLRFDIDRSFIESQRIDDLLRSVSTSRPLGT
jgi:ribosome-binding factor A